ncbi:similar to suprabasal-specific protein suprabasin (predicted), isoform CRA_c [Rattus norvegicus]|uniref:Similar to suprabasal-specific protein suprabasin (Predicted), isoform CRA_c n=1 Tax=Rattus norvegicus TaxID=10116 RepID=A6JA21_RAT|nr:similar to suprabasal-specific protein suprabasin (predicted), isoform CRA_c [Rattus norvegicus]
MPRQQNAPVVTPAEATQQSWGLGRAAWVP